MKGYAKEVIRQQPDNIFDFSARYFAQLEQEEEERDQGTVEKVFFFGRGNLKNIILQASKLMFLLKL